MANQQGAMQLPVVIKQEPQDPPPSPLSDSLSYHMGAPPATTPDAFQQTSMKTLNILPRVKYMRSKQSVSSDAHACEVCQAEFTSHQLFQAHKMCHFNTTHVCYVCDTYFLHPEALIIHMATVHRQLHPFIPNGNERENCICSVCLQRFSLKAGLVNHLNMHASKDANNYSCKVCGLDFMGSQALIAHLTSPRHTEMKVKIQSIFVCVDCRSIFASRDSYAMHMMLRAQSESCKNIPKHTGGTDLSRLQSDVFDSMTNNINQSVEQIVAKIKMERAEQLTSKQTNQEEEDKPPPVAEKDAPLNLCVEKKSPDFDAPIIDLAEVARNGQLAEIDSNSEEITIQEKQVHEDRLALQDLLASPVVEKSKPIHDMNRPLASILMSSPRHSLPSITHQPYSLRPPTQYKCEQCPQSFHNCDTLAMHVMTDHVKGNEGPSKWEMMKQAKQVKTPPVEQTRSKTADLIQQRPRSTEEVTSTQNDKTDLRGGDVSLKRCRSAESFGHHEKQRRLSESEVNHTQPEELLCGLCSQRFEKHRDWLAHTANCKMLAGTPSILTCKTCHMTFMSTFALSIHLRSPLHKRRMGEKDREWEKWAEQIPPQGRGQTPTACTLCDFSTYSKDELADHYLAHSLNRTCENIQKMNAMRSYNEASKIISSNALQSVTSPSATPPQTSITPDKCDQPQVSPDSRFVVDVGGKVRETGSTSSGHSVYSPESSGQRITDETTPSVALSEEDENIVDMVRANAKKLAYCKHCKIIYLDRTVYYLHMGLHNLNNPWQCNLCGKVCRDLHEFSSHVMHYS